MLYIATGSPSPDRRQVTATGDLSGPPIHSVSHHSFSAHLPTGEHQSGYRVVSAEHLIANTRYRKHV